MGEVVLCCGSVKQARCENTSYEHVKPDIVEVFKEKSDHT